MANYREWHEKGVRVGLEVAAAEERGEHVRGLGCSDEYGDRAHRGTLAEKSDEFLQEHFMLEGYKFGKQLHQQTKSNYRSVFDSIYD